MSKERARQRAKSNALKKAKRRAVNADSSVPDMPDNRFNSGNHSIKSPGGNNKGGTFSGARRGSARSS